MCFSTCHYYELVGTPKKRLNILESKCSMLQNLALDLHKVSLLSTSNNKDPSHYVQDDLEEEEMVH
jgi:hypothetical protein